MHVLVLANIEEQVEVLLEQIHRTQDADSAREPNWFRSHGGRPKNHGRRRVEVRAGVMLASSYAAAKLSIPICNMVFTIPSLSIGERQARTAGVSGRRNARFATAPMVASASTATVAGRPTAMPSHASAEYSPNPVSASPAATAA